MCGRSLPHQQILPECADGWPGKSKFDRRQAIRPFFDIDQWISTVGKASSESRPGCRTHFRRAEERSRGRDDQFFATFKWDHAACGFREAAIVLTKGCSTSILSSRRF
jgi:hypothetical protein